LKSDQQDFLSFALKRSTAEELYRVLCTKEDHLSMDMKKLIHYLENYILESSTIETMEELFEKKGKE